MRSLDLHLIYWSLVTSRWASQLLLLLRADLHSSLQARGSALLVLRGKPEEELPRMWREWGIKRLCFEVDTEEYARTRDARICELAAEAGSLLSLLLEAVCGQRGCASF